jgi:hypothetical protein
MQSIKYKYKHPRAKELADLALTLSIIANQQVVFPHYCEDIAKAIVSSELKKLEVECLSQSQ